MANTESVPISIVKDWLDKKATFDYDWRTTDAKIDLWIYEMEWLDLISFNAKNKEISFTEKGIKAYQSQEFHLAYANMLQAKSSCNLAKTSLWIAISTLFITALGIIITIILK